MSLDRDRESPRAIVKCRRADSAGFLCCIRSVCGEELVDGLWKWIVDGHGCATVAGVVVE